MAIGNSAICGTFKREALAGIHFITAHTRTGSSAISADAFKIALYTNSSSFDADTTGYTTSEEISGTNYTAGGNTLASATIGLADNSSSVPTAFVDFADTTWSTATITNARGALIYNSTLATAGTGSTTNHAANPAVAIINFGGDKSSSAGDFTVQFPTNDANTAIIRVA
jgi:hypothetical protein